MGTVLVSKGRDIITGRMIGSTPTQAEPKNLGWGTGSGAAATPDVALIIEAAEARVAGTSSQQTTTTSSDTYQVVGTITSSSGQTITEFALADGTTKPPSTTLSAAITTTGQTSITVTSATGFPGSGNYSIQIDNEVLLVTAGQGTTTWTVSRGTNGSTAATHSNGAVITAGNAPGSTAIAAGGSLLVHSTFTGLVLASGDSIQATVSVSFS